MTTSDNKMSDTSLSSSSGSASTTGSRCRTRSRNNSLRRFKSGEDLRRLRSDLALAVAHSESNSTGNNSNSDSNTTNNKSSMRSATMRRSKSSDGLHLPRNLSKCRTVEDKEGLPGASGHSIYKTNKPNKRGSMRRSKSSDAFQLHVSSLKSGLDDKEDLPGQDSIRNNLTKRPSIRRVKSIKGGQEIIMGSSSLRLSNTEESYSDEQQSPLDASATTTSTRREQRLQRALERSKAFGSATREMGILRKKMTAVPMSSSPPPIRIYSLTA